MCDKHNNETDKQDPRPLTNPWTTDKKQQSKELLYEIKNIYKSITFYDTTFVSFKKLNKQEINYYIENYNPLDKAGSYAIQEWIGLIGINKIEGSYFNVVGLPSSKLYSELIKFINEKN